MTPPKSNYLCNDTIVGPALAGFNVPALAQLYLVKTSDSLLDPWSLLMPSDVPHGRTINGAAFQAGPLISHNGHQYTAWYRKGSGPERRPGPPAGVRRAKTSSRYEKGRLM